MQNVLVVSACHFQLHMLRNLWAVVKKELDDRLADNLKNDKAARDLVWAEVQASRDRMKPSTFANLIESFPRRLRACVKAKGDWIDY